jgi:hypothetical protein
MDIPVNDGELIHLADPETEPVAMLSQADIIAQIPEGIAVKLEVDVTNNLLRYVALTPEEIAQRETDEAADGDRRAAADAAQAEQDVLKTKLAAGKASDVEVQQALAQLLP